MSNSAGGPQRILIAGYYATGSGYPNGEVTQEILSTIPHTIVIDCGYPMPLDTKLWKSSERSFLGKLRFSWKLLAQNFRSVFKVMRIKKPGDIIYVRYPAIFFLVIMSTIPIKFRPTLVADAFISLWESWSVNRAKGSKIFAKILFTIERIALTKCTKIIVDTTANSTFIAKTFSIHRGKIDAMPLGLKFIQDKQHVRNPSNRAFTSVLFVGTFIPLHGISVIIEAMKLLHNCQDLNFKFIGDGSEAYKLEAALKNNQSFPSVEWIRTWQSSSQLAEAIEHSDICLGIFSGDEKSRRVLPYKLYMYMMLAKCIISQSDHSSPAGSQAHLPICEVPANDPSALAKAILFLKDNPSERKNYSLSAAQFYNAHLSRKLIKDGWMRIIHDLSS
ncbi:glycosyltransferase [Xanthomonas campestris]|uniref:glycosyltransferase n=1 Tax=Xanthomonas campestris TaxID=339 RepID=UPI003CF60B7C